MGRRLTTAQYVSFFDGADGDIPCLGLSASVDRGPGRGACLTLRLNNPDLSSVGHVPASFRYLANHVPRDDQDNPITFEDIAGNGLLGVLKVDVDHLGQIFQEGLRRDAPAVGLTRSLDSQP